VGGADCFASLGVRQRILEPRGRPRGLYWNPRKVGARPITDA
jgi:hypothetical protein